MNRVNAFEIGYFIVVVSLLAWLLGLVPPVHRFQMNGINTWWKGLNGFM